MMALSFLTLALAGLASPYDELVSRWAVASDSAFVRFLAAYTDVGQSALYLVSALAAMTVISLSDWRRRGVSAKARLALVYSQSAFVFATIALSGILANIIKLVVGRARPRLLDELGPYDLFQQWGVGYNFTSFPSGHATTMGALAAILAFWCPRLRFLTLPICLLGAASRVAAGAHYPSDVIAGFGLGFLFSVYLARFLARRSTVFRFDGNKFLPKLQFSGAFFRR